MAHDGGQMPRGPGMLGGARGRGFPRCGVWHPPGCVLAIRVPCTPVLSLGRDEPSERRELDVAVLFSFQLLFDFLAFKNDISFWKKKRSMIGMSTKAGRRPQLSAVPRAPCPVDGYGSLGFTLELGVCGRLWSVPVREPALARAAPASLDPNMVRRGCLWRVNPRPRARPPRQ